MAPTPPSLIALANSPKSPNAVPSPHNPNRFMYAMCETADAPVAEQ